MSRTFDFVAYVRGHPGDFDAWAEEGAIGWSYRDVLPYFKKSEGLTPSVDISIDAREAARGGCEHHAERGERQHERGVDHDRREGSGDAGL